MLHLGLDSTDIFCPNCLGKAEINESEIQERITQTCPTGSSIREIRQDGAVLCETDDTAAPESGFTGSGTTNFLAKFTEPQALGNSALVEVGGKVGINAADPTQRLEIREDRNQIEQTVGAGPGLQVTVTDPVLSNLIKLIQVRVENIKIGTTGSGEPILIPQPTIEFGQNTQLGDRLRIVGRRDFGTSEELLANFTGSGLVVLKDLMVLGSKTFIQDHPDDATKVIAYSSLEGPRSQTYISDEAQLSNGIATVQLPEHFEMVTSTTDLNVILTPYGECNGLYVQDKNPSQIVVKELRGGTSNVKFSYIVLGIRKGFESVPVIQEKRKLLIEN